MRHTIALALSSLLLLGACDKDKGDDEKPTPVSDADLQAGCDNLKKYIGNSKRAARIHDECLTKTRDRIPEDKLAGYVSCLKAATSELEVIACSDDL